MNAYPSFPSRLHWDAEALAHAVPRRLHELFAFQAAPGTRAGANAPRRAPPRPLRTAYARNVAPPRFRIA